MKLISIIFLVFLFSVLVVEGSDVAYLVLFSSNANEKFIEVLEELNLSYTVIPYNEISSYDYSDFKFILLNDDNFPNYDEIPVNEYPALLVNSRHMDEWGWTRRLSVASQNSPIKVNLSLEHEINDDFSEEIVQIYDEEGPDIYYLDKLDVFNGLEIVAATTHDDEDVVIALAREGTSLSKGDQITEINADSIFFGIHDSKYWTEETKQLFKNCMLFLVEEDTTPPNAPVNFQAEVDNSNILLSWDEPEGEAVDHYNIYTSSNSDIDTFNFVDTSSLTSWLDVNVAEQKKFYMVRAVDAEGNEENNTNIVGKFNIQLEDGINLISLVLIPFSNDKDDVFGSLNLISLKTYENGNIVDVIEVYQNKGYFLELGSSYKLVTTGKVDYNEQVISLEEGMNLVGVGGFSEMGLDNLPSEIIEVARLNVGVGNYEISTYYEQGWFNGFNLEPGRGYWFKTNNGVIWNY